MPVFKARKVVSSLLLKGFVKDESHHHYFEFWYKGQLISKTYTSHNGEDIGDFLISAMRKQCNMNKAFFIEFIQCTKSKEDHIKLLIEQNLIENI